MKSRLLLILFLFFFCSTFSLDTMRNEVDTLLEQGDFAGAEKYLNDYLEKNKDNLNPLDKKDLKFEIERISRIKKIFLI